MRKSMILKKTALCLMAAMVMLTGCKSGEATGQNETGNSSAQESSSEKTRIEYWHVNAETQGGATVAKLVEAFNAQSDTVEVVEVYNADMYKGLMTNLQAETAAGNSPAVVQVGWAFLEYFSNNFTYTPLQEVIDNYAPEDKTFLDDYFNDNILDLAKNINGDRVGLAYSLSTPVLYINRDMLKEAGLSEEGPATWEEVKEFAKTITDETGKYGFYLQEPADFWAQQGLIESNGAAMIKSSSDGSAEATFASKEGIEAFELYADMVLEDKSALHVSWDEGIQAFISGEVGMLYTTIAQRANVQDNADFDVATISSPAFTGEAVQIPAGGCFLAMTAQGEEEQKATWEFMKYLYSVESMAEWTMGTGYVPPRNDVAGAEEGLKDFLAENEMMDAAISQMDGVASWVAFPGDAGMEAEQILLDMRDEILGGSSTVEAAMTAAEDKINELLK